MKKTNTIKEIAKKHRVTTRTVRAWLAEGAPLENDRQLSRWLAARRQPPRAALPDGPAKRSAPRGNSAAHETGAAAALKRLEMQEVEDFTALQTATRSGDELQVRLARDRWLRTSESLRKYDLAIEASRRESGELIPRAEVERCIRGFAFALSCALRAGHEEICPDVCGLATPSEVWLRLRDVQARCRMLAVAALHEWPYQQKQIPAWVADAVAEALSPEWTPAQGAEHAERIGAAIGILARAGVHELRKEFTALNDTKAP